MSLVQNFSNEGVQDMVFQLQDMLGVVRRRGSQEAAQELSKKRVSCFFRSEDGEAHDPDQVHRDAQAGLEESGTCSLTIDKVVSSGWQAWQRRWTRCFSRRSSARPLDRRGLHGDDEVWSFEPGSNDLI